MNTSSKGVGMIITIAKKPRVKKFPSPKEYKQFSELGLVRLTEAVYQHYRKVGFLYYPTDLLWRHEQYQKLVRSNYIDLLEEDGLIRQSMAGLALAWSFMPHSFEVRCGTMRTPYEAYSDDVIFRKVVKKVLSLEHPITLSGVRKVLRMYSGTQGVSNFRPTTAACLYHHLNCKGKVVWDMSCGYGGRLLGANLVGVGKYIGTEPCEKTMLGIKKMAEFCVSIPIELHQCGSEDFIPEDESIDLCFTSPPYFNTEQYSVEKSQSWVKFPSKEEWREGFLKKTFSNCWHGLKPNGLMVINIANVKTYPTLEEDTVKTALEVGFSLKDTWKYALSSLPSVGGRYKYEPIFIFQKEET